jgi:hypothetical protein
MTLEVIGDGDSMAHYYLDSSAVVKCYASENLPSANPFDYAHLDQPEATA